MMKKNERESLEIRDSGAAPINSSVAETRVLAG